MKRYFWIFARGLSLCSLLVGLHSLAWSQMSPIMGPGMNRPTQSGYSPGPGPNSVTLTPKLGDGTAVLDLDPSSGDQNIRTLGGVKAGQKVSVQVLLNKPYANASAFEVVLKFDPTKVSVVGWRKDGTAFASALDLPAQTKADSVTYGAAILGGTTTATGALAVLTFRVANNFSGDTEILLKSVQIRVSGVPNTLTPGASIVLSTGSGDASALPGDFDGNGVVDFNDFFMFADDFGTHMGGPGFDAMFDMDGNGTVDFNDFFMFGANFGMTMMGRHMAGKVSVSGSGANAFAGLLVGTVASNDGLTARLSVSKVTQLRGYSLMVTYDPSVLAFVRAERAADALLSRSGNTPLFLVRNASPGRVIVADVIAGGGTATGDGGLANLIFRRVSADGAATVNVDQTQLFDGVGGLNVVAVASMEKPDAYTLAQNTPNPFNPTTQITFSLLEGGRVHLVIYNLLGQVVRDLVNDYRTAGAHAVTWNGKDAAGRTAASGIYLYRIDANGFSAIRRMALLK